MTITPDQLRAARALVGWSREALAERSGVSPATVRAFEILGSDPKQSTLNKLRTAFSQVGVDLLDETEAQGAGVRFRKPRTAAERSKAERSSRNK